MRRASIVSATLTAVALISLLYAFPLVIAWAAVELGWHA